MSGSGSEPLTLLVVEDEPLIRIELADRLPTWATGFSRRPARMCDPASGSSPRDRRGHHRPEHAGSMDGLALARIVRERWPPCALIMVSGHHRPDPSELPSGLRFLSKPVATRSLERTLASSGWAHRAPDHAGAYSRFLRPPNICDQN